jgi:valyl-tRNA synthetase
MVPPNLTGDLHLGHGLMLALQDAFVRHARRSGLPVTYVPGFDHAGIGLYATVVHARDFRPDLPIAERLRQWAEDCLPRQRQQMQAFDVTCDWDRELYTLSPGHNRTVRVAFHRLAAGGLVHRDFRVVDWCPVCATTISDMEATPARVECPAARVPVRTAAGELTAWLSRPELLWGVTAVVHGRRDLGEGTCTLPDGREVPLLRDERIEDAVVLCVPAHDRDAFELARVRGLEVVDVLDRDARSLHPDAPGLDPEALRAWTLRRLGLASEPRAAAARTCGRCGAGLLPRRTWQWFVRMGPLAEPVLDAMRAGRLRLTPDSAAREALEWLTAAEDWCVSRQIPWGHTIPALRCTACAGWATDEDGDADGSCGACGSPLVAETDVLDTWFSSSLWFLTTAGWPDRLDPAVYPYSIVTTGRDILLFWIVRTLGLCEHLAGAPPTGLCLLHGLVLDGRGRKMSKSEGNAISLQEACDLHGPDVVRAALLGGCHEGQDVRLTDALLRRQARARAVAGGAAGLPRRDGGADCLDHWLAAEVRRAAGDSAAALDRREADAAVEALDALLEGPVSRYVAVRAAEAAAGGVPGWLLAELAAALEPVMPRASAGLLGAASGAGAAPTPDAGRAAAGACWMAAVREVTQLRGPAGLNTSTEPFLRLPAGPAALLSGEPWVAHGAPLRLRLGSPPPGFVEWRFALGDEEAAVHLPPAHAARLQAEARRRLRVERERLRELRRRAPAGGPVPPALARRIAQQERLSGLLAGNAERAQLVCTMEETGHAGVAEGKTRLHSSGGPSAHEGSSPSPGSP